MRTKGGWDGNDGHYDARTQTERAHPAIHQHPSSQNGPDRNVERDFASPGEREGESGSRMRIIMIATPTLMYHQIPEN